MIGGLDGGGQSAAGAKPYPGVGASGGPHQKSAERNRAQCSSPGERDKHAAGGRRFDLGRDRTTATTTAIMAPFPKAYTALTIIASWYR